jgi:hypothetical protein
LLLAAALLACGSPESAQHYFEARRDRFERVVEIVTDCRATRHYVTADGIDHDGPSTTRCATGDIAILRSELRRHGIEQVFYSASENSVQVEIPDRHLNCHVVFESEADPDGGRHIYSPSADDYERFPLTDAPYHWFCESIGL